MGDVNLKKNGSVLLYLNISGLDLHFMFSLMGVRQLLDTQSQQNTFMSSLLTSRQIIVV